MERAGRGQVIALGILGAQPDLDRGAALRRSLGVPEVLAARDPDLLAHEIEPGGQLGHRVLHLEPRVDLEEAEVALLVRDELDGTGPDVAHGARS